ncbi:MAG TPA: hypothetical protein VLH84_00985 [Patescibacteria group bacterium]|nr:hypothetical protein [Patescibacteria group bacterium]
MFKKKTPSSPPARRQRAVERSARRSSSAPVFSYYAGSRAADEARAPVKPSAAAQRGKRRMPWLERGPLALAILAAVTLLVFNSGVSTTPKVMIAGSASGQIFLRPPQVYGEAAHALLAGSFLNRNKITINTGAISAQLSKQFPELAQVSVSLPLFGTRPVLYVEPATPKIQLSTASGVFVIAANGRALIAATQVAHLAALGLPLVTDQSGLTASLGQEVLPSTSVDFITEFIGQLQAKGIIIASLTLPRASSELDVHLKGVGYYVKCNLRGDARAEAGTYLAAIAQLGREHKTPGSYIDVRVDQRAYYQ